MNFTERQIEIIDASKDLIGRKGIQNLTIKNLAKKMSFSEPALYRHFKDKTEILKSLLLFHREIIKSGIFKILNSDQSSLEKFQEILKFKFDHIKKNPAIVMVIFSENSFQYSSVLSSIVSKIMKQRSKKIIELLKEGQKNNEIRDDIDPEQLATIIMGGIRKTILNWKLEGFKSDLNLEGEKLWITIEKLIKK
ncbi:MAG: TetR/AcrR family transcriptional regulator [Flavobacteriales bacterium]|jgi:AcrR family transcriptional regulator|nr:TetR/AcrR family transcriptional regulator [Flavobacteriales bacterium]MBT4738482.1 TetR/AcrR family transcriptional regulator [Flavobacteriales bacterium]MBT7620381.1 TetR/AcrR family transcriptional regulator [Flavobacteriales bacterium]MBT7726892.1 TetR/AcrR family transcriptional regulator [Flavobacteriales bacterium]